MKSPDQYFADTLGQLQTQVIVLTVQRDQLMELLQQEQKAHADALERIADLTKGSTQEPEKSEDAPKKLRSVPKPE